MENRKVLVVATSRKTRGGITSVIKAHETGEQWKKYHCKWIETHRDSNKITKIIYAIKGAMLFMLYLPFYSIIHFHVSFQGSLTRKYYFSKIARATHKKIIVHFHPPTPDVLFNPQNTHKYKELFSTADKVHVLSEEWKKLLYNQLGIRGNVDVLYNPCPQINQVHVDNEKKDNRYILFAGTLIKRKGYQCLIKAFAQIAPSYPDWKLILAGNGELDSARTLIKQYHIEKQVKLTGWMEKEQIKELYKNASIFCLASSGEGFPMAVLEAWAYGIPVITTLVGGLPDIVIERKNALTFDFDNNSQLSNQLSMLIQNTDLRNKLSQEGIQLARQVFNIQIINKQLENIYEELSQS